MKNVQVISLLQQGEFAKINVQKDSADLLPNEFTELRNVEIDQAGKIIKCQGYAAFGGTNSASAHDIFEYKHQGQSDRIFIARDDNSLAKWVYSGASYGGNSASITYKGGTADWDRLRFNVQLDVLRAATGNGAANLPIWYDYINRAMFANASAAPGYYLTHAGIKPGFVPPKGGSTYGTALHYDGTYWYFFDRLTYKLLKLDNKLQIVKSIGGQGTGNDQFGNIQSMDSDGTYLYLVDDTNKKIQMRLISDLSFVAGAVVSDTNDRFYGIRVVKGDIYHIWWDDSATKNYVVKRDSGMAVLDSLDITAYAPAANNALQLCRDSEEYLYVFTAKAGAPNEYYLIAIDTNFAVETATDLCENSVNPGLACYFASGVTYLYTCEGNKIRKYSYTHATNTFAYVDENTDPENTSGLVYYDSKLYFINADVTSGISYIGKMTVALVHEDYLVDTVTLLKAEDNIVDTGMTGGKTYGYKFSLLYDGYQEGPLSINQITSEAITADKSCDLLFYAKTTNRRISHIKIYRDDSDVWKYIDTISMNDGGWVASKNGFVFTYTDKTADGSEGSSYENITGLSQTVENVELNFKSSRMLGNHQYVIGARVFGDKVYPTYIFRSQLNKPDVFDWANEFNTIKGWEAITGIATAFDRIIVFTKKSFHIINPYTFAIEEDYLKTGALSQELIVEVEDAVYFADEQNIWELSGGRLTNISKDWIGNSYQGVASKENGVAAYDRIHQEIWFCFGTISWLFNSKLRNWHRRLTSELFKRIIIGVDDEIWTTDLDDIVQRDVSGYTETIQPLIISGFLFNSNSYKLLKRVYVDYKSSNPISLHLWKNSESASFHSASLATASTRTKNFILIPQRIRNLKVRVNDKASTNNFEFCGIDVVFREKGL